MIKTTKIKIGEIFEVEGKLYVVGVPVSAGNEHTNIHGQIVAPLIEID